MHPSRDFSTTNQRRRSVDGTLASIRFLEQLNPDLAQNFRSSHPSGSSSGPAWRELSRARTSANKPVGELRNSLGRALL